MSRPSSSSARQNGGAGAGAGPESEPVARMMHPSTAQRCWREVVGARNRPPARSGAASVVCGDKMFIFGGYGGDEGRLDDFWEFCFGACSSRRATRCAVAAVSCVPRALSSCCGADARGRPLCPPCLPHTEIRTCVAPWRRCDADRLRCLADDEGCGASTWVLQRSVCGAKWSTPARRRVPARTTAS